jgi:hypothetical protein
LRMGFAVELDAMGAMKQSAQDGVGEGRLA